MEEYICRVQKREASWMTDGGDLWISAMEKGGNEMSEKAKKSA